MNSQELEAAWTQICKVIRTYPDVKVSSFDAFFSRLQPQAMSGDYLMITADNTWIKDWVEKTYKSQLLRALHELYNMDFTVEIEVDETQSSTPVQNTAQPSALPSNAPTPIVPAGLQSTANQTFLSQPLYSASSQPPLKPTPDKAKPAPGTTFDRNERFDNFVTGDSNILAYELAVQVAASPGKTRANPLFIYGKSGLGKTHLLRAIQNEIHDTIPQYNVIYTDTMDLVSRLTDASREHSTDKQSFKNFSSSYIEADVLLIDDVQMLATKTQTLTNVFQFINTLKSQGKQVVLAADRAPRNIEIDQRYTSRFAEGTVQDISTPSVETKLSIIKNCLEEYREDTNSNFDLPYEIQEYIAEVSSSNIRELKGALSRISFNFEYSKQDWRSITKDQIENILQDSFSGGSFKKLTATDIQKEVADFYKVSVSDIIGPKRSGSIAYARQVAIYLCQKMLGLTQSDIGKLFGNRDHSTIMYSETKVATKIKEDWTFKEEIDLLTQIIREA